MSKFNTGSVKTAKAKAVTSPVKTKDSNARVVNESGHLGFQRGVKSELYLLAVSNLGKDSYYESAKQTDDRFVKLCREVAVDDQVWFTGFVNWLRNGVYVRSAAIVAAAEGSHAILAKGKGFVSPRALVAASMARADEPGEFLAYWNQKFGAKSIPASVKKGISDSAVRLYNEYSVLKYDTGTGVRFGQILQVTHPKAKNGKQNDLFKFILDKNYGNANGIPESLDMMRKRGLLMGESLSERADFVRLPNAAQLFTEAGMTWEALAGWLQGPMDAKAWEAVIPNMGYMALLRNLRNFMDAGVNQSTMKFVFAKLSDPEEVAKSKQFPFRFLSAYQANKGNLKVSAVLEEALQASLANIPSLSGRTLILVDRSGSMFYSQGTQGLDRADTAALFGTALSLRAECADLVQFGTNFQSVDFRKSDSVLPLLGKFSSLGGTNTHAALKGTYKNHDRVVVITDEQYNGYYGSDSLTAVPKDVPVYTWNLGGYASAHGISGKDNRHTFGGLTDRDFSMIPLIEQGVSQTWPWVKSDQ